MLQRIPDPGHAATTDPELLADILPAILERLDDRDERAARHAADRREEATFEREQQLAAAV